MEDEVEGERHEGVLIMCHLYFLAIRSARSRMEWLDPWKLTLTFFLLRSVIFDVELIVVVDDNEVGFTAAEEEAPRMDANILFDEFEGGKNDSAVTPGLKGAQNRGRQRKARIRSIDRCWRVWRNYPTTLPTKLRPVRRTSDEKESVLKCFCAFLSSCNSK